MYKVSVVAFSQSNTSTNVAYMYTMHNLTNFNGTYHVVGTLPGLDAGLFLTWSWVCLLRRGQCWPSSLFTLIIFLYKTLLTSWTYVQSSSIAPLEFEFFIFLHVLGIYLRTIISSGCEFRWFFPSAALVTSISVW